VLRDNIITSAQLDEEIDAILKHSKWTIKNHFTNSIKIK
jgi:DNA-binding CsgD family transcriptional regulator